MLHLAHANTTTTATAAAATKIPLKGFKSKQLQGIIFPEKFPKFWKPRAGVKEIIGGVMSSYYSNTLYGWLTQIQVDYEQTQTDECWLFQ